MTIPLLVIAAGGTGGHMFPAQALAEAMLKKGWRVRLSTDVRGARYTSGFPKEVEVQVVGSATFAHKGLLTKLAVPFRIFGGLCGAVWKMAFDRPALVVGFGGYPAIPALAAAWVLRLPRMVHEQNGVLGRVNQVFARRVHKVACGVWPIDVPSGADAVHVGNPVRHAVLQKAGAPYEPPGPHPMSIVVMGGSQGAKILSDVVPSAITGLPSSLLQHIHVSHQARPEDLERVQQHYEAHGIAADVQSFFSDIPERLQAAQVLISRSGASTVADATVIGRPAIWIPLASAIRGEQHANIKKLISTGASYQLEEHSFHPKRLTPLIEGILSSPQKAEGMAAATYAEGKPDAIDHLVHEVEQLAKTP